MHMHVHIVWSIKVFVDNFVRKGDFDIFSADALDTKPFFSQFFDYCTYTIFHRILWTSVLFLLFVGRTNDDHDEDSFIVPARGGIGD
jgi:hypothetical protein